MSAEAEVAAAEVQKERVAMGIGEGVKLAADEVGPPPRDVRTVETRA